MPAALALAATFVLCWAVLDRTTRRTNAMIQAVEALHPATRVLVAGSSHVDCAVQPFELSVPARSLSGIATNYVCLEAVLAAHLPKLPALEVLVLELDLFPLRYDTLAVLEPLDQRPFLDLRPDLGALAAPWRTRVALAVDDALSSSRLWGPFFSRYKPTPDEALRRDRLLQPVVEGFGQGEVEVGPGWRRFAKVMDEANDGRVKVATHLRESSAAMVGPNTEALVRIVRAARGRGLTVVLLRLPHHHTYRDARPPELEDELHGALARVRQAAGPGAELPFWDLEAAPGFDDGDFYDGDHLNARGSRRFTALLDGRLAELLGGERMALLPEGESGDG